MPKIVDIISSRSAKEEYNEYFDSSNLQGNYNSMFVWKSKCEDFNTMSQLIVDESEEALFYANGQALDLFGPGRHTLKTQNIPLIRHLFNLPTGGETPFHCKVYFINKTEKMAVKWGTDRHVEYTDPMYNFPLSLGASGEMSLRVEDSRKLIVKLVGTESVLTQDKLVDMLRGILLVKFKSIFTHEIKSKQISIFDIDENLDLLSKSVHEQLKESFSDYGLSLERFMIVRVVKPEGNSTYERFKDLHFRSYADIQEAKINQQVALINQSTESQKIIMESQAIATKRSQEGYTYQEERSFDVSQAMAANESIGEFTNMGIGLGAMVGLGSSVATNVASIVEPNVTKSGLNSLFKNEVCSCCGAKLQPNAKFCLECGTKIVLNNQIICPRCGSSVPRGKFCVECGYAFYKTCPKCGKELDASAKFCTECGCKL